MRTRIYNKYREKSISAINGAINSFNQVYGDYNTESTIILLGNAWELLAKSILIKKKEDIYLDKDKTRSISLENALYKLKEFKIIDDMQSQLLFQVVSLRNEACHAILPPIPLEIQQHLFFFSCKIFKNVYIKSFKKPSPLLNRNFLSLSFDQLTTYADCVQKLVSKIKHGTLEDRKLIWLLERGVCFEGKDFISQNEFEKKYKEKYKPISHLQLNRFIKSSEMLRIIAVQAPKNFTADITLRKGKSKANESLPVIYRRSNPDESHPYLTSDIAKQIGRTPNYTANLIKCLGLKGQDKYHLKITTSKSSAANKYSEHTVQKIKQFLEENPNFNPWKKENIKI